MRSMTSEYTSVIGTDAITAVDFVPAAPGRPGASMINCASGFAAPDDEKGRSASGPIGLIALVRESRAALPFLGPSEHGSDIGPAPISVSQEYGRRLSGRPKRLCSTVGPAMPRASRLGGQGHLYCSLFKEFRGDN
jgi:hypothetical protein